MLRPMRAFTIAFLFLVARSGPAAAGSLGHIEFPTTGPRAAQEQFLRGVMALHSFFYDEALEEFRAAQKTAPTYPMAYWGEAMALNQTIWENQDTTGARKVLSRISSTATITPKEKAWIAAVRVLYGEGDKPARDKAYAQAMERMAEKYPDDLEVRAFQSLALLGTLGDDAPTLATRMRAGAVALAVLARNPRHPGAAHYVIHSFDDADHAVLALPAARRYAVIAPAAFHARHMPSHIFVNLGMWDEAAAACESAWAASQSWIEKRRLGIEKRDYHSLEWLVSIYHQQGKIRKAEQALATFAAASRQSTDASVDAAYSWTVGSYLARTRQPERLESLLAAVSRTGAATRGDGTPSCHATTTGNAGAGDPQARVAWALATQRAFAAADRGDAAEVARQQKVIAAQVKVLTSATWGRHLIKSQKRTQTALAARLAVARERWAEAEKGLVLLIAEANKGAFRGAADPAGRALETQLGDVLMAQKKYKEAAAAYRQALSITPADSLALLGAARAARALGDEKTAAAHYRNLYAQWRHADPDFPGLAEVRAGARLASR
jgi:tetratricopeptide (TPR) repeat protein